MATKKTQRALNLAAEKGSSAWLTVLPPQDLGFNLNKREFRVKLSYDRPVDDKTCAFGGSLYGWSIYDLQTRKFYYSTPQRAKRCGGPNFWVWGERCWDWASPPRHRSQNLKKHKMRERISTHVGSGSAIDRQSLMWGSVTLMLNHVGPRAPTDLS